MVANLASVAVLGVIVWWFWLSKPTFKGDIGPDGLVEVTVQDGVYTPSRIEVILGTIRRQQ